MSDLITIEIPRERRTYIKGRFKGKYWGLIKEDLSDGNRENYYNIEVYEGEITTRQDNEHLRKWQEGDEFDEYKNEEPFLTKIPSPTVCNVHQTDGTVRYYKIDLHDVKLTDLHLYNQLYEGEKLFGTIEGNICGYFIHFDVEQVEIASEEIIEINKNKQRLDIPEIGTREKIDDYERTVIRNNESGNNEWTKWEKNIGKNTDFNVFEFLNFLIGAISILFWIFVILMIISAAWKILLPIAVIWLFFLILSSSPTILSKLSSWILKLLSLGFLVYLFIGLITLFKNPFPSEKRIFAENSPEEIQQIRIDQFNSDTILSNLRSWNDYDGYMYEAKIEVYKADYEKAKLNRLQLPNEMKNSIDYNTVVYYLNEFDQDKLNLVYNAFDSIKIKNNLNERKFAEMIVSCIQDIPYTLILDKTCNSQLYDDAFIKKYIREGGNCEGNIKFGIYSPVEFSGNLLGDCDTRTLLLYTILSHFNYDVAMLGSDAYRHSILAINLPYPGVSKIIHGKRYVLWETTAPNMKPGEIPLEISNTENWQVNLLSK
ncbi:MAG: hypothetical protein ACK5RQ_09600 [Bacteroidota bacterium]